MRERKIWYEQNCSGENAGVEKAGVSRMERQPKITLRKSKVTLLDLVLILLTKWSVLVFAIKIVAAFVSRIVWLLAMIFVLVSTRNKITLRYKRSTIFPSNAENSFISAIISRHCWELHRNSGPLDYFTPATINSFYSSFSVPDIATYLCWKGTLNTNWLTILVLILISEKIWRLVINVGLYTRSLFINIIQRPSETALF